jgi:para-aminobenzoate synthetase
MTIRSMLSIWTFHAVATLSVSAFVLRPTARLSRLVNNAVTNKSVVIPAVLPVDLILIDHYDSFTYNLVDMLTQLCGKPPAVYPSDCADTWAEFLVQNDISHYDGIVLSPGPGHPRDCALGLDSVRNNPNVPILGVCLGHQIIGMAYNATVDMAPEPIHGQIQKIKILREENEHDDNRQTTLFEGIDELSVTRYHSLQVSLSSDDDSSVLRPTAIARDDRVLMALRHADRPHWGVQFHPESIGTNYGMELLGNFVAECSRNQRFSPTSTAAPSMRPNTSHQPPTSCLVASEEPTSVKTTTVWIHKVPNLPLNGDNLKPEHVMDEILAADQFTYWLDHSDSTRLPGTSILGSARQRVEYYGREKKETFLKIIDADGMETTQSNETILSFLERHVTGSIKVLEVDFSGGSHSTRDVETTKLPFSFLGGFIGYLGYEVRLDLSQTKHGHGPTRSDDENVPTAAFVMADRTFVYCHETCQWYLVGTFQDDSQEVEEWMIRMSRRLQLGMRQSTIKEQPKKNRNRSIAPFFLPKRSPAVYARNFDRCLYHIGQGDSYELCLTNQLETLVDASLDPLELHKILRTKNPAPYSAFMNWGGRFAICSSSPERFLSVKEVSDGKIVEAKPIKGTIARILPKNGIKRTEVEDLLDRQRAVDLQGSVKDRAENLMIVDLLRNDLSRVCQPGTVHVSKLMGIESYATVHQMVSTIRGSLDGTSKSTVDVLRACFPGGSMTGAPKVRSMEILNELEEGAARGPYSGCMGYLSLNGAMDMSILIRTAVLSKNGSDWNVRIGAGGAITALSDRKSEFNEMMLKADVVMRSVQEWTGGCAEEEFAEHAVGVQRFNSSGIV